MMLPNDGVATLPLPKRLVVDTDIVIHLLKKQPQFVAQFLALIDAKTTLLLSPIVVAEVYAGAFAREHKDIEAFFGFFERINIDSPTGKQAGLFATQHRKAYQGISLEDYLLAATAQTHACPLWTGNRKHHPLENLAIWGG
jgi:predicted nucleic acid-binding protein